ncbi:hypothetical protein [Micromonospora inaquosa]|uniref:Uncharacterized protein n=1 Tax=Micromonospora inaquosa TaxID=2203716 RepID=A0A3N9W4P9_9ACTN|nr:hypothetical protein [Micromonospora inaquosa]RQW95813.1 hypothetical protein DLJ59_32225 [Micromonospora inaquosa]
MGVEDANIVGLVGVEYPPAILPGRILVGPPWSFQERGSRSGVTDLDDQHDDAVGGGNNSWFLNLKSSPLSFVPLHSQHRGLRRLRERQASAA